MVGNESVVVVGAGIGGLAAAIHLTAAGRPVLVLERGRTPGGKLATVEVGGLVMDAGPSVLSLLPVFASLFEAGGSRWQDHLALTPLPVLSRHVWPDGAQLDLMADPAAAEAAFAAFGGAAAARGLAEFRARAARCYAALEAPFLHAQRPGMLALGLRVGTALRGISPMATLWDSLGEHFADPRLRQLFGRMAAYVGSSPLAAPATLMLVAHVEFAGAWAVEGGMVRLPLALAAVAAARGATFRFGAEVADVLVEGGRVAGVRLSDGERIQARQVVLNADPATLAAGQLGAAAARGMAPLPAARRSFSAVSWAMAGRAEGRALPRHTVFHPADPLAEYAALTRGTWPATPTVTLWAQDRVAPVAAPTATERLQAVVAAPARGDARSDGSAAVEQSAFAAMDRGGVTLTRRATVTTTPADYERGAPGTGGALYGPAVQGFASVFARPSSRSGVPGLFLAGGATHPGAGMAMAAVSGGLAAAAVMEDRR